MNRRILASMLALSLVGSMTVSAAEISSYPAQTVTPVAGYYNGETTLNADLISRFSIGGSDEDGGLIEIVTYNTSAQVAYAVAGSAGQLVTIPMTSVTAAGLAGEGVNMAELVGEIEGFVYGDMSSIAINSQNTKLAVALQAEGYNDDGMVAIFDVNADGSLAENPQFVSCGKQPDALTFTPDGTTILVANEGEPREGCGDDVVDPEGSVTMIDVAAGTGVNISFEGVSYDSNVLLKTGSTPSEDFEPEYIACDNTTAYVALQENNAIAVLDIASASFTGVYGLGLQNFGEIALDMIADEVINIETQDNVYGIYMPDGISMAEIGGTTSPTGNALLLAANEVSGTLAVIELTTPVQTETEAEAEVEVEAGTEVDPEIEVEVDTETEVEVPAVSDSIYTVKAGDCLWNIAKAELGAGTRWGEILVLNPEIAEVRVLQIGQILAVPGK